MKHIFVINPIAGKKNCTKQIEEDLKPYIGIMDYEIYVSKFKSDSMRFVKEYLSSHPNEETCRFYAAGGDGTLFDVINGAEGYSNVQVCCLATGSGNDFAKNFTEVENFRSIKNSYEGTPIRIDLMKINDRMGINIANFGFDGKVTYNMLRYKKLPFMNGSMAYLTSAVTTILGKINQDMTIKTDGEILHHGGTLLAAVANGYCYGGGFNCCPEARINDGLLDICVLRALKKTQVAGFMKLYRKGEHVHSPKVKDIVIYKKCREAEISSEKDICYAIDGEVFKEKNIKISIIPHALDFVLPKGSEIKFKD